MNWTECSDAFHKDGSLRDLYAHGTTARDWDTFLAFLTSSPYKMEYTRDGESEPIPADAATVFADREHCHNLIIRLGKLGVCCHFFIPEEIELDIDPREVSSQVELDAVMKFMSDVGATLRHDIILTEENGPEYIWFRYSHEDGQMHYRKDS